MRLTPPASAALAAALFVPSAAAAFAPSPVFADRSTTTTTMTRLDARGGNDAEDRRRAAATRHEFLSGVAAAAGSFLASSSAAPAPALAADERAESLDIGEFLRTGVDTGGPMGVSSQAGKSRPETGVVLRDGSEVSRDSRSGDVLAEILLGPRSDPIAVLATFSSPWPLATGTVYDVECRDSKTGDGAFLAVTTGAGGASVSDLPPSFFLDQLFAPTGRFSFYGPPTDIRAKKSEMVGSNRIIEVSFSNLSQSTQTEIPRNALVAATIPEGTDQAVMLVASAAASRWRRAGSEAAARKTVASFRAVPAPRTSLKIRAKERGFSSL